MANTYDEKTKAFDPLLFLTEEEKTSWGQTAGRQGLVPVDSALLSLRITSGFPIYVYDESVSCFVLLRASEREATVERLQKTWSGGRQPVFVPRNCIKSLTSFAASDLEVLADDPGVSPATRSRQVYAISKVLLIGAFSVECDNAQLEESSRSVSAAISDLVDSGGVALRHVILAQAHDPSIYTHSLNVCVLGTALSSFLHPHGSMERRRHLAQGFLLHDIGKMDVCPEILIKPAKLTVEELEKIRKHPVSGYQRVKDIESISEDGRRIVLEHHELCDGTGYPFGQTKDRISEGARICSIVESYEDLTSARPYHAPLSVFQALKLMQEDGMGKYDTDLFKAFISFFRSISTYSMYRPGFPSHSLVKGGRGSCRAGEPAHVPY